MLSDAENASLPKRNTASADQPNTSNPKRKGYFLSATRANDAEI
jgi:hypothetical protein